MTPIVIRDALLKYIFKLLPVNKNQAFFNSFNGLYNDNCKQISIQLHKDLPEIKQYWLKSDISKEELPKYITAIKPNTVKALYCNSRSKFSFDNYLGWQSVYAEKGTLKHFYFNHLKKRKQLNIATWHGMPLKKINLDEPSQKKYNDFVSTADYLCCGSTHLEKLFDRINFKRIPLLACGTPRNDVFFKSHDEKDMIELKNKLNLPTDRKILVFAPTFRDDGVKKGLQQLAKIDVPKLLETLEKKTGDKWCFVYRVHDSILKNLLDLDNKFFDMNNVYNGNVGDDMGDYLLVADFLLTDYSSSMFDIALTNTICMLLCDDLDYYSSTERGMYFDMSELPFPYATNFNGLLDNINKVDYIEYNDKVSTFLKKIGMYEKGKATEEIIKIVKSELQK
jgi:CDP-glycerol glycerophosphotransferase